jgi:hypothetical protein
LVLSRDASSLVKVELDQTTTDEDEINSSQDQLDETVRRVTNSSPTRPLLPSVEEVMKKWNMFQFGEVVVPNHPTIPVVPMALQMVYLYPLSRGEGGEVRYRMLVPMHHHNQAGAVSPPIFAGAALSPSPPAPAGGLLHINLPQFPPGSLAPQSSVRPGSAASDQDMDPAQPGPSVKRSADGVSSDGTKSSPPLDLTNKSPDKEDVNKQQQQQHQRFLESQINLIKIKELELLKNAASATAAAVAAAANNVSPVNVNNHRCNDCNINFTKYQNYLAHKKYYCSGVKQQQQQQQLDSDDPEASAGAAGSLEPPGQQLRQQQQQLPPPPKCKSPRVAQERMARELLLKQQEALQSSLLAGIKTSAMPLLVPNPRCSIVNFYIKNRSQQLQRFPLKFCNFFSV